MRGRVGTGLVVGAAALAALPLAFRWIDHELLHAYQKLWVHFDRRDLAFLGFDKHLTRASPFQSWYGALGLVLVIACFVLAWIGRRQRLAAARRLGARAGAGDLARPAVDHDLLQPLGRALRRLRASRSALRSGGWR